MEHLQKTSKTTESNNITEPDYGEEVDNITFEEFKDALYSAKNCKSPGIDSLNIELIRYSRQKVKQRLLNVYNLCWHEKHIPHEWLTAVVIPFYKKEVGIIIVVVTEK